jgi:hypothetical protein
MVACLLDQTGSFTDDPGFLGGFHGKRAIPLSVENKPGSVYFPELFRARVFYLFVLFHKTEIKFFNPFKPFGFGVLYGESAHHKR